MSNRIWIVNASPLILLGRIGCIDLLEKLAQKIAVPQAVYSEVAAGSSNSTDEAMLLWAQDALRKIGE